MSAEPKFFETNPQARIVGQPLSRVGGPAKVRGEAKYAAEYALPGLYHAVLRTSDVAKGRIRRLDASAARRAPGGRAVLTHESLPKLALTPHDATSVQAIGAPMGFMPLTTDEIFYAGQPMAVVVADTLERAQYAATLLEVQVSAEQPAVSYRDAGAQFFAPPILQDGKTRSHSQRGNPQAVFAAAPVQFTHTYEHPINHHNPMEPGTATAHWEAPDQLRVYESTQGITRSQQAICTMLGLPQEQVRVITKFIGGGFGCKGSTWPPTMLAVLSAKVVGRPVKLALTRPHMFTSMGHREDHSQK